MSKPSSKSGAGCLILFSLPFAGVGVFMLYLTVSTVIQSRQMSDWPTVPGTILEAELKVHPSSDGSSEEAVAKYEYLRDGVVHRGEKVALGMGADNIGSFQKRKADTLIHAKRNQQTVPVHVNPENPAESILYPELRIGMIGFYLLFVLLFGGAGFGMLIGGILSARKQKIQTARAQERPEEPWTWKEEWSRGEIRSGGKSGAWAITGFAVFWNLISSPVLFAFREEFFEKENKAMLIALVFPLVGAGLLTAAVYLWMRHVKYGSSVFLPQRLPGVIGGTLQGAIRVPRSLPSRHPVQVTLKCVRRITTRSGRNSSTREVELWSDSRHIPDPRTGPGGETLIPVHFGIPFEHTATDESNSRNKVVWKLTARAETPGVDYQDEFEVPVFKTSESDPGFVVEKRPEDRLSEPGVRERLIKEEHIRIGPGPMGATQLVFPMMRHRLYAFFMILFTVIWDGATYAIYRCTDAPLLFPIVFGLFAILITTGCLDVCFSRQVLNLKPGQLELRNGLFGLKGPAVFSGEEIGSLKATASGSRGSTSYYTLKIKGADGKRRTLASQIKGRGNADALITCIRQQTGMGPDS